jgi:hypothetical protein
MGLDGIFLAGGLSAVERVISHSNGDFGIHLFDGSVIGSVGSVNKGIGISAPMVSGSTAAQNGRDGIRAFELATGNVALLNGGSGITVDSLGTVTGNTAKSNGGFGIIASCPSSVVGNTTSGNRGGGISASGCILFANAP